MTFIRKRLNLRAGLPAKEGDLDKSLVNVEVYLNGKWTLQNWFLTRANIEELKDGNIHDFTGDDSREISVRLPGYRK